MARAAVCVLLVAAAGLPALGSPPYPALVKHVLTEAAVTAGARCLDGSVPALYYSGWTAAAQRGTWLVFIQGGGWCYDAMDCLGRSAGEYGSSRAWGDSLTVDGVMDRNCTNNPSFCGANHVFLRYCDGASFAGFREAPLEVNGTALYFRGRAILHGALDMLLDRTLPFGMHRAERVLLSGCSAGGLATYLHADALRRTVAAAAPALRDFRAAPISGFFLNHANLRGDAVYTAEMQNVYRLHNVSGGVDRGCLAAHPGAEGWRCLFAPYVYPHVSTPTFVINSAMDQWQGEAILGGVLPAHFPHQHDASHGVPYGIPEWTPCLQEPYFNCSARGAQMWNRYRDAFMTALGPPRRPGHGAFIHSCHLHCAARHAEYHTVTVAGATTQQALTRWWEAPADAPAAAHLYTPCRYLEGDVPDRRCNPSCPDIPPY
eukprot:TRINITY_DN16901_c0_g1_i1.p1 TRINITY_DN16901_c0_g1~~TRINITY_DN16901_c0_g1_i1.p1  ORF type:complete len:468 (+),score=103.24 TRINITY_DN16901_c0_g1_i1:114-1406(+)